MILRLVTCRLRLNRFNDVDFVVLKYFGSNGKVEMSAQIFLKSNPIPPLYVSSSSVKCFTAGGFASSGRIPAQCNL